MASSSFSYSDFTPVKPRKKRHARNGKTPPPLPAILATLREQLRQEEWFAQCSQIIKSSWDEFSAETPAVLCLGLGSPSSSPVARIQLAFLAETCQRLNVAPDRIAICDPVFSAEDTALLAALNMRVLAPGAAHALTRPTLCFMPHCDIELYDALLRANWSAPGLARLFVVGNALQEYVDSKPRGVLQAHTPCLLRAAPLLELRPLPPARAWPTAFNNTAVQFRRRRAPRSAVDDDAQLFADAPWAAPHAQPLQTPHPEDAPHPTELEPPTASTPTHPNTPEGQTAAAVGG